MTLFQHNINNKLFKEGPLAFRMRPENFNEFVGQSHILGEGKAISRIINAKHLPSLIFWGPPGSGKTTLAHLLAKSLGITLFEISAVSANKEEIRKHITDAKSYVLSNTSKYVIFIDEIHRFNKTQQDVLLPHVESGLLTIIGATTENPSFEIISPLLSRSTVLTTKTLTSKEIETLITRALQDKNRGLGKSDKKITKSCIEKLASISSGDARMALNILETLVLSSDTENSKEYKISDDDLQNLISNTPLVFDKKGDHYYDTISALIKSIRDSDPDAAVYWLARILKSGQDPKFICRRLVILASEDIGLADPQALVLATSTLEAVHFVGMPESRIILSQTVLYLALAPKSNNAYQAITSAMEDVDKTGNQPVPLHLRNATSKLVENLGYGKGYKYTHNFKGKHPLMENLPEVLKNKRYYKPSTSN